MSEMSQAERKRVTQELRLLGYSETDVAFMVGSVDEGPEDE